MTPRSPDRARVVLVPPEDEIDHGNCHVLEAALTEVDAGAALIVDMASVRFCDSSGLRVLLSATKRQSAGGGSLRVVNPGPNVRRLFEITDLETILLGDAEDPG